MKNKSHNVGKLNTSKKCKMYVKPCLLLTQHELLSASTSSSNSVITRKYATAGANPDPDSNGGVQQIMVFG